MNALAYSLRDDRHASAPADVPSSEGAWTDAYERQLEAVSADDLWNELFDVAEWIRAAAVRGDAKAIGEIVLNVRRAYAGRCADLEVLGELSRNSMSNEQAAALAIIRSAA